MTAATVAVRIPTALRPFSDGSARVTVATDEAGCTLADLLDRLARTCPGVVDRVVDEQGKLRRHVNVFVGVEDVRDLGGLDAPVAAGSEVSIVPAVSGGAPSSSSANNSSTSSGSSPRSDRPTGSTGCGPIQAGMAPS